MSSWEGRASGLRAGKKHGRQHEAWKKGQLARLRAEGLTMEAISQRLGVAVSTLQQWAREMRIARKPGRPRGGGR